ncbi:DUF7472 family protein [Natronomonas gomsonensis]|uniref:DUF7472 family protein n=1 Tax=Natronomonas gomsonensis TaxID=1046043 RepID=UPI0020CA6959|nr:hypothetical protein [Natronomonas gomsonensis]
MHRSLPLAVDDSVGASPSGRLAFEALLAYTVGIPTMDRDAVVEAIVAFVGVATLVAIILYIGNTYNDGGLSGDGGVALVGAIAFFIVFMSVIGVGLSRRY